MCSHADTPRDHIARSRRDLLRAGLGAAALVALRPASLLAAPRDSLFSEPPRLPPGTSTEHAIRAARWLSRHTIRTPHGSTWAADPDDAKTVGTSLYSGSPGVVLFLLELHRATGDQRWLREAVSGADHLAATLPATFDPATVDAGLYTGLAGIAFTLEETARIAGSAKHRVAARRALDLIVGGAQPAGNGVRWSESTDIISGNAGVGLYLIGARRVHSHQGAFDTAIRAADRLLEVGKPERGGMKWGISPSVPRTYPNFSHGAAGVGYFLATLHEETGEKRFLDGALQAAAYLQSIATTTANDGRMVFHSEPGNESLYYLSWCHGPAGTARLFHRLGNVSGDASWNAGITRLGEATFAARIPEQRTPGFWNNVSQCCGNCGVLEYALAMHRRTREARWMELARRSAADTLQRGTTDGDGLKWVQAEHRVRPELLVAQTGLMQGAAGVGLALLHLDAAERGVAREIVLPDDPWG